MSFVVLVRTVLKNCADVRLSNKEEGAFVVESVWVLINDAREEGFGRSGDRRGMGDAGVSGRVLCDSGKSKDPRLT